MPSHFSAIESLTCQVTFLPLNKSGYCNIHLISIFLSSLLKSPRQNPNILSLLSISVPTYQIHFCLSHLKKDVIHNCLSSSTSLSLSLSHKSPSSPQQTWSLKPLQFPSLFTLQKHIKQWLPELQNPPREINLQSH